MNATNYDTPSARMVIDYVADSGCVTLADLEAYFAIPAEVAKLCVAASGVTDCGDGTYEIPDHQDPDDLMDTFAGAVGVDFIDIALDQIDGVLAKVAAGPQTPEPAAPEEPAKAPAEPEPEPKGDGTNIGDPDHDEPAAPEAKLALTDPANMPALVEALTAQVEALTARVEALEAAPKRKPKKKGRAGKKNLQAMLDCGLVAAGDHLRLKEAHATLHSATEVIVDGTIESINAWALRVTGWQSCNIYNYVKLVDKDRTLDQIRRGL